MSICVWLLSIWALIYLCIGLFVHCSFRRAFDLLSTCEFVGAGFSLYLTDAQTAQTPTRRRTLSASSWSLRCSLLWVAHHLCTEKPSVVLRSGGTCSINRSPANTNTIANANANANQVSENNTVHNIEMRCLGGCQS